ncbi:hypothetical protein CERSUDRAFT_116858 [Gelatoporia subvermispora B]|uniref:Uncharacterized protein n=1 Tax=Ceriporiopsis subvermispora (strain B) TaxID=914234 RepID=M2PFF7_CERS8|nr:hypothetical protein CERSUDRAFT_116858 [Gelatoporia subvermispora B]
MQSCSTRRRRCALGAVAAPVINPSWTYCSLPALPSIFQQILHGEMIVSNVGTPIRRRRGLDDISVDGGSNCIARGCFAKPC